MNKHISSHITMKSANEWFTLYLLFSVTPLRNESFTIMIFSLCVLRAHCVASDPLVFSRQSPPHLFPETSWKQTAEPPSSLRVCPRAVRCVCFSFGENIVDLRRRQERVPCLQFSCGSCRARLVSDPALPRGCSFTFGSCRSAEEWTRRTRPRRHSGWMNRPSACRRLTARIPSRRPKSPRWPWWPNRETSTWEPSPCRTQTRLRRHSQARRAAASSSQQAAAEWGGAPTWSVMIMSVRELRSMFQQGPNRRLVNLLLLIDERRSVTVFTWNCTAPQ